MKMQKLISLCLAVMVMFCMSANVFAAPVAADYEFTTGVTTDSTVLGNKTTVKQEVKVGSSLYLPTIKVTVAKPASIIVNPYGMVYETGETGPDKKDRLISSSSSITNDSTIAIKVSALPKALQVTDSKVKFSSTPLPTNTDELAALPDPTVYVKFLLSNFENATNVTSWTLPSGVEPDSAVVTQDNTKVASITMPAQTGGTASAAGYKFEGSSGGSKWDETDLINISITFSIDPVVS